MTASTDFARRRLGTGLADLSAANEILGNLDNAAKTTEANTFNAKQTSTGETAELGPCTFGIAANTAATGTVITNAAALPAATASIYPVTASDNTKGVQISTSDSVLGREFELLNLDTTHKVLVYPPTNGTINGAAANAVYTGSAGLSVFLMCYDGTNGKFRAYSSAV